MRKKALFSLILIMIVTAVFFYSSLVTGSANSAFTLAGTKQIEGVEYTTKSIIQGEKWSMAAGQPSLSVTDEYGMVWSGNGYGMPYSKTLADSKNSICYLTDVKLAEIGKFQRASCYVVKGANNWILYATDDGNEANSYCQATCLTWDDSLGITLGESGSADTDLNTAATTSNYFNSDVCFLTEITMKTLHEDHQWVKCYLNKDRDKRWIVEATRGRDDGQAYCGVMCINTSKNLFDVSQSGFTTYDSSISLGNAENRTCYISSMQAENLDNNGYANCKITKEKSWLKVSETSMISSYAFNVTSYSRNPSDTKCRATCINWTLTGAPACNNDNNIDPGEQCDGGNVDTKECTDLGFLSGKLYCDNNCRFDTSACSNDYAECTDTKLEDFSDQPPKTFKIYVINGNGRYEINNGEADIILTGNPQIGLNNVVLNVATITPMPTSTSKYKVFSSVKTDRTGVARIIVADITGKSEAQIKTAIENPISSSWNKLENIVETLSLTFEATSGKKYLIGLQFLGTGLKSAYFDNVKIQKWSPSCEPCTLNSINITSNCANNCKAGDTINVKAGYSGYCNFSATNKAFIQIDMGDKGSLNPDGTLIDGTAKCVIQNNEASFASKYITGGVNISCANPSSCTGTWTIPEFGDYPNECLGKNMLPRHAALWQNCIGEAINGCYRPGDYLGGANKLFGNFTFNSQPRISLVKLNITKQLDGKYIAKQGTAVRINTTASDPDGSTIKLTCKGYVGGTETELCSSGFVQKDPSCTFNTQWSDADDHSVDCRVNDGNYDSVPYSVVILSDNTGETIAVNSPEVGTWQNSDFTVSVMDGEQCKEGYYNVSSSATQTKAKTKRDCNGNIIITTGLGKDCRHEGENKCTIHLSSVDVAGNPSQIDAAYNIDWTNPTIVIGHSPSNIIKGIIKYENGGEWLAGDVMTFSATANDAIGNVTKIEIYNTTELLDECVGPVKNETGYNCKSDENVGYDPAKTYEYKAKAYDTAGNVNETTKSFTVCGLKSVVLNPRYSTVGYCSSGGCKQGEKMEVAITTAGACPSNYNVNITLATNDGVCSSIYASCNSSTCTKDWTVPDLPAWCRGSNLTKNNFTGLEMLGADGTKFDVIYPKQSSVLTTNGIIIKFAYPAGWCASQNTANNTCLDGMAPLFCLNGEIKSNAEVCGCKDDQTYMIYNNACDPAKCGITAFHACDSTTGLYCDGIPKIINGVTVYTNVSLIPNKDKCSCPSGSTYVYKPYNTVYIENFDGTPPSIILEDMNGSSSIGGVWSDGYAGTKAYRIQKNNTNGSTRALLGVVGRPTETYPGPEERHLAPGERYLVNVTVSSSTGNFARIYDKETGSSSRYHTGGGLWETLAYEFNATMDAHTIAFEVSNTTGTAKFDNVIIKKYDYVCTPVCFDGTPLGECSSQTPNPTGAACSMVENSPEYVSNYRCGCAGGWKKPEPGTSEYYGKLCVRDVCRDGTQRNQCQTVGGERTGKYCFPQSDEPAYNVAACGCGTGFAADIQRNECVQCPANVPPTGGYAKCTQTGGALTSNTTLVNGACSTRYSCSCQPGKIFTEGDGCITACAIDKVCDTRVENSDTCPQDCQPGSAITVGENLSDTGIQVSADVLGLSSTTMRVCSASASIQECNAAAGAFNGNCSINSKCLCGSGNFPSSQFSCKISPCYDKALSFYVIAEENLIVRVDKSIVSDVHAFNCPEIGLDHLQNNLTELKERIIPDAYSFYNCADRCRTNRSVENCPTTKGPMNCEMFKHIYCISNGTEGCRDDSEEEKAIFYSKKSNEFNEGLALAFGHREYLDKVLANPAPALASQALAKTRDIMERIMKLIYPGGVLAGALPLEITSVTAPETIANMQNVTAEVHLVSHADYKQSARAACKIMNPQQRNSTYSTNCVLIEPNATGTAELSFYLNKEGIWNIAECSADVATSDNCQPYVTYKTTTHNRIINVTQAPLLIVTSAAIASPKELKIGDRVIINATVLNRDDQRRQGELRCTLESPSHKQSEIKSEQKYVSAGQSVIFTASTAVSEAGTWTAKKCIIYRIGSFIEEGGFDIADSFVVEAPDFEFSPSVAEMQINEGGTAEYEMTLKNIGKVTENYTMTYTKSSGFEISVIIGGIVKNQTQLQLGKSQNISLRVVHIATNATRAVTTLAATSSLGRTKQSTLTTTVNISTNKAPKINITQLPAKIRSNMPVVFSARITDPEGDEIKDAMVCPTLDCADPYCVLTKNNSTFRCSPTETLEEKTYNYNFVASDGMRTTKTDSYQFTIVANDYCDASLSCPSGLSCSNNKCVQPISCPGTNQKCYSQGSACVPCSQGSECVDGKCKLTPVECNRNTDCDTGKICRDFKCIDSSGKCTTDDDCSSGQKCLNSKCAQHICAWDSQCPADYKCKDNECIKSEGGNMFLILMILIVIMVPAALYFYIKKRED